MNAAQGPGFVQSFSFAVSFGNPFSAGLRKNDFCGTIRCEPGDLAEWGQVFGRDEAIGGDAGDGRGPRNGPEIMAWRRS
jgi:hypothetical protein